MKKILIISTLLISALLVTAFACSSTNHKITFLLANVSSNDKKVDIWVYIDGKTVLTDTLEYTDTSDLYRPRQIETTAGIHDFLIESKKYNVRSKMKINLWTDTSYIIEFQHVDSIDRSFRGATMGYPTIDGGRKFFIISK